MHLTLDKSNFDISRLPADGCMISVHQRGVELTRSVCDLYADYDRNQLHAMRQLLGKLMTVMLERVNEDFAHTVTIKFDPRLWLVKLDID